MKCMTSVLIVDDDCDGLDLSRELLEAAGYRIHTGNSGKEGLGSLRSGPLPDCVLLDVDMPVQTGPEMAHQMLLHDMGEEKIPVVLVSARSDLAEVAARMGTPYYLRKASPGFGRELAILVARALRERKAPASA